MTQTNQAVATTNNNQLDVFEPEEGDELIIGTDAVIESMRNGEIPLHIEQLMKLAIPEEEKEPILSVYLGTSYRKFDAYVNEVVEVQGAAILYHGPYKGKDQRNHAGYYYNALLTTLEDEKGNLIVIKSSSASLLQHLAFKLIKDGWYIWSKPTRYRLSKGEDGSHRMTNMERPKLLTSKKNK